MTLPKSVRWGMGDDDTLKLDDDVVLARRGCRHTGVMESAVTSSFLPRRADGLFRGDRRDGSGAPHRFVGRTAPRSDGSRRTGVSTTIEPASERMPTALKE
mmetsp:Transcript_28901/g.52883  ORF Transcript_28901/g.52883 Transcript_28901/m.52883 type:complete len:101 (+) Transcript_28901:343-645(+)